MPLSAREKKRRSRARQSSAYHAAEREASRKRMAMNRARNRAQKRACQLKSVLNEAETSEIEARADEEKQRLVRDWFKRNGMRFDLRVMEDEKILGAFMSKSELCVIEKQLAEFEISVCTNFWSEMDDETNAATSREIDSSEQNLDNQINRFSEKEMAPSVICGNEVAEISGEEQEDAAKPADSGKNGIGALSEGKEDCISWEDEVLAAEAMAIMQHMRRAPKPAKDFAAPGAKAALQGAPQAHAAKEKGEIPAKNASVNAKIKARILHKVALAVGPSVADAMRGALTQAANDKANIPGTHIRPRAEDKRERSAMATEDSPASAGSPAAPASRGTAGSRSSFPTRYSDGAPIIAGTAAAQMAIATATAVDLVLKNDLRDGKWFGGSAQSKV